MGINSALHIIIFDELDAICKQRGTVVSEEKERIIGEWERGNLVVQTARFFRPSVLPPRIQVKEVSFIHMEGHSSEVSLQHV